MAIEIVDFPIENGDFPDGYVSQYQRVNLRNGGKRSGFSFPAKHLGFHEVTNMFATIQFCEALGWKP